MKSYLASVYAFFVPFALLSFAPNISMSPHEKEATIHFTVPVDEEDALYQEYIDFSCDQEWASVSNWRTDSEPVSVYDPIFKEDKKIFTKDVTFDVDVILKRPIEQASLRFTFYRKSNGTIQEQLINIPLQQETIAETDIAIDSQSTIEHEQEPEHVQQQTSSTAEQNRSLSCQVSDLIEHTNSLWLQCLLILLLGALLSLTPCIYPMIPITVGILQGQGSSSFMRNLFVSLCYTMGVATTFAALGVTAAYTGKLFGTFMQHPVVVLSVVALLVYLALSMFGFYEMYIPKSMSANQNFAKGGSPIAAFLFGVVSGTVASPCVSPGLALVLSIVTGLKNPLLGFIFMFMFGIGLSLPLLIIGTFSGSLNVLPQAGMWMIEIKKFFGFLMLAMSIYFVSTIIPAYVTVWLFTILMLIMAGYYLKKALSQKGIAKLISTFIGCALIVGSCVGGYFAIRASFNPEDCTIVGLWTENYTCAREQAQHENKKLLLKVEAPCCSMCTAIDKKFFQNTTIIKTLEQQYIPVRIDGSDTTDPVIQELVDKFSIVGFPTIIIIDPVDEVAIKTWASELYHYSIDEFNTILKEAA